jgi:cytochrome c biogenesis protein CcmG/thiol:disulfide interchange protein DsbE
MSGSSLREHPARLIALAVGAVVAALAVVLATQVGRDESAGTASALLGDPAPTFAVTTLDGDVLALDDLAGRAVIVNFWNTWCIPCREELPALQEFYARHADEPDFAMVGIVRDDTERAVRSYVKVEDMAWTIALDADARAALGFGTRGQPETFAITPDGLIAGSMSGPATVDDLETMLTSARALGG